MRRGTACALAHDGKMFRTFSSAMSAQPGARPQDAV